ncbi:MAG TPA: cupredoxin domain-containing protein [Candidatus Omnitrophota bacterium]|nr:cupredoxin domain-containing protein [Candidatus Omnitrophota bacterium]
MKRLAVILPLLLAACAGSDDISSSQPVGFVKDARQVVDQADWSNPQVVEIDMANYEFRPDEFTVRRGKPVKLVLRNVSTKDHTFVSKPFFKGIAVKQVVSNQGAVAGPYVEKIVVEENATKEVWFVPTRYGAYQFECDVTGHALLGMKGVVNVVE